VPLQEFFVEMGFGLSRFSENQNMSKERYWMGTGIGPNDDFGKPIADEFVDGKTRMGPWAIMSPSSHRMQGLGLGLGKGQRYKKQQDGRWLKVEG
jgi:hypothetical protein